MSILLIVVGLCIGLYGGIWFLCVAFKESILWGLGCLFVPFCSLLFLITHWQDSWKPFLINAAGVGLLWTGLVAGAASMPDETEATSDRQEAAYAALW